VSTPSYSPGLEGVIGGQTAISHLADTGLYYRGYSIQDLAERATFEEVAYLLLMGELPTREELADFRAELAAERAVPPAVLQLLATIPPLASSMDALRTGISFLAHFDPDEDDDSHGANVRKAVRLLAKIPTLIGARHQLDFERSPLEPKPELSHAANLLYLITGKVPDELAERVMDRSLILYAEHEFNASTFAARVTVSTLSDLHSGITSAIGALKGPLHGGANEAAMETLLQVAEPERAEAWVMDALARKERIMGFGHRVLRGGDSRARILKEWGLRLAEQKGDRKWSRIADTMETVMAREKGLYPNVDFPCGWTYYLLGLPVELYTPIFVASRTAGWSAHIIEQLDNNRLIRPRSEYTGPAAREFVPLERRE
jgi:2-methylcitrate synthase/citrate synthase II